MNHCVPIYDYFIDDEEPFVGFLVMPLLRRFNDPPFYYVDEVMDFIKQTLEVWIFSCLFCLYMNSNSSSLFLQGLVYIHNVGVAHRYCTESTSAFSH